jgi:hypothetical protein
VLILISVVIVAIWTHPRGVLLAMSYAYLASGLIGFAIGRFRRT